jgi:hypothetical protein
MKDEDVKIGMKVIITNATYGYDSNNIGKVFKVIRESIAYPRLFILSNGSIYDSRVFEPITQKCETLDPNWTKEQLIAYDSFLLSEMNRHFDDIKAICEKRALLHIKGFKSEVEGPWIHKEEIARM